MAALPISSFTFTTNNEEDALKAARERENGGRGRLRKDEPTQK